MYHQLYRFPAFLRFEKKAREEQVALEWQSTTLGAPHKLRRMDGASSAAEHAIACDVWEAVRLLSDAELLALQQRILDAHSGRDTSLKIPLGTRAWALPTLLFVLTNHIHDMVHKTNAVADAPVVVVSLTDPSTPSHAHHKNADPVPSDFALRKDEFPSLGSSSSHPSASGKANKPSKRRITTTLVSAKEAQVAVRVVSPAAFPALGVKAKRGAGTSVWPKQDLLERRMVANQLFTDVPATTNSKPQPKQPILAPETPVKRKPLVVGNQVEHSWSQVHTPPPSTASPWGLLTPDSPPLVRVKAVAPQPPLVDKQKRLRRVALLQSASDTVSNQDEDESSPKKPGTPDAFSANLQAAKLYGFLILQKLVANTCSELQVIMSMLFRRDCAECTEAINFGSPNQEREACARSTEFCWQIHCRTFAAVVCEAIESVISNLGSDLLQLIIQCLSDAIVCDDLTNRLRAVAQTREQWRVEESARIGCKLPIETKASAVRDFALPFCDEVDSRLHYRTPTETLLYTNREKVRDGFLSILRQFQRQQHSLLGMDQANVATSAAQAARALLTEVTPENRWWFAKFFVMELVQVGSNPFGESDKDLVLKIMEDKLVGKNPDRLRKLHRRFSSQKQSTAGGAAISYHHHINSQHHSGPSNAAGPNINRPKHNSSKTTPLQRLDNGIYGHGKDQSTVSASDKAVMERMRSFLGENQLFFFHFLHSCDSFEFSQLVQHQIEWQFLSLWNDKSDSTDPRKTFTDVVLKLKVMAKFLGYLRFSPQWHASSTFLPLATQNAAFRAAQQEAVRTLETSSHHSGGGVDVQHILEQSITEGQLSMCIPWLCDYLMMLSLDKLSSEMGQVKHLLVLLEQVYRSPRLAALGETGLYIRMQIERVFQVLDMDVASGLRANNNAKIQLNGHVLEALTQTVSQGENGVDTLPFLYSQVFLESCVSELYDLRGYIQTRAKPSHRVTKRAVSASVGHQQGSSIRKLRPLQVLTEEVANPKAAYKSMLFRNDEPVEEEKDDDDDDEHDPLADALFKLHPGMKKSAEFIVGAVVTYACEHVMINVVTHRADELVDSCLKSSGWPTRKDSNVVDNAESVSAAADLFAKVLDSHVEQSMAKSVVDAMQEATRLCEERVRTSLPPLIAPSSHHTLVQCVTNIALKRTRRAVNNVIPKSSRTEFSKRIAARKKTIVKEAASASAIAARSKQESSAPNVVSITRTLCSMFDAHVGKDDDDDDDEDEEFRTGNSRLALMKQCGADIVKLAAQIATPTLAEGVDTFTRQQNLLIRHLRRFVRILNIHQGRYQDPQSQTVDVVLCDLTWRVMVSCLQCVAILGESIDRWRNELLQYERVRLSLETSVEAFTGQFSLLLDAMLKAWTGYDESKLNERVASLISFIHRSVLRLPPSLFGSNGLEKSDDQGDASLLRSFVLKPRARLVDLIDNAVDPRLRLDWSQWLEPNRARSAKETNAWEQIRDFMAAK